MSDGDDLVRTALDDLARGFTVRAGARLRKAVATGNVGALRELCRCLNGGRIPGTPAEARPLLERADDTLDPESLYFRAAMRIRGLGGPPAAEGALQDLEKAAGGGLAEARIEMAMLWQERADEKALASARLWLHRACPQDDRAGKILEVLPHANAADSTPPLRAPGPVGEYRSEPLHTEPHVERFADVLSPAERAWLRLRAQPRLAPSRVLDPRTGAPRSDPVRTGETMYFEPASGVFIWRLAQRLAALAGRDPRCAEPLAVLRYGPGQEYKPHHDGLGPQALARDPLRAAGDRVATVLAWLDVPASGGATLFPRLGLRIVPTAGDALVFSNLTPAGEPSPLALHAGEPVAAGEKWIASLWIRARPVFR